MSLKVNHLDQMVKGWFVGDFEPSVLKTKDVEVGIKRYKKGEYERLHFHKIATEITVILKGKVEMNGVEYKKGEIITINPGVATDFRTLEDVITVVVKYPGASGDKYPC